MRKSSPSSSVAGTRLIVSMAALLAVAPLSARAATVVWDGDTSTDLEDGGNWVGGVAPAQANYNAAPAFFAGDFVQFGDPATVTNLPTVTASRSVGGVTFDQAGWTLGTDDAANILTVTGSQVGGLGIVSNGAGTNVVNANVRFAYRDSNSLGWNVGVGNTLQQVGNVSVRSASETATFFGIIDKDGAGTLELYGTGSVGRFNVKAGTVKVMSGQGGLGGGSNATLTLGADATYDVFGANVSAGNLSSAANSTLTSTSGTTRTFTMTSTTTNTLAGLITGNLNFVAATNGQARTTHVTQTDNTYTGYTRVNGGNTVNAAKLADGGLSSSIGVSTNAAANLVLNSGFLRYTGGTTSSDRNYTVNSGTAGTNVGFIADGTGALTLSGNMTGSHTAAVNFNLRGDNADLNTLGGVVANGSTATRTTTLIKSGAGTWALTGLNTYAGATALDGGTLVVNTLANAGSASSLGNLSTTDNAGANAANFLRLAGTLSYRGAGSTTDRLFALPSSNAAGTIESSGTGAVNFTNAGTVGTDIPSQSPINYAAGATVISVRDSSKLAVGVGIANSNGSIPDGTYITAINTATNQVTLSQATTASTDTGQTLLFVGGPRSLVLGGSNADANTLASQLVDPASSAAYGSGRTVSTDPSLVTNTSLTKTGAGTWALSNANTYTGGTSVTAGTLLLTNTTGSATGSGAVNVSAGTLGGTGIASGPVTIGDGLGDDDASVAPGMSVGTLSGGAFTFLSDAVASLELNSDTLTADLIDATSGSIDLGDGTATLALTDIGTTVLTAGTQFTLATSIGGIDGYFAGLAPLVGTTTAPLLVGSNAYTLDYLENSIVATVVATAVPEPSSLALVGLAGLAALRRRRHR